MNKVHLILYLICTARLSMAFVCLGGGEGPVPVEKLAPPIYEPIQVNHPPQKGVQDFVFWQKRNSLVIRDTSSNLFEFFPYSSHFKALTNMHVPLSRVIDPQERYLLGAKNPLIYDTERSQWLAVSGMAGKLQHLFWNKNLLYTLSEDWERPAGEAGRNNQILKLYEYRAGNEWAKEKCTLRSSLEDPFHLAKGHDSPYVYLYKTRRHNGGKAQCLSVFRWDINQCRLYEDKHMTLMADTQIKKVFRYPRDESLGIWTGGYAQSPVNFYYAKKGRCIGYGIGQNRPYFLGGSTPTIATWNVSTGSHLNLYYLDQRAVQFAFNPENWGGHLNLREQDLWLTEDRSALFAAPEIYYRKNSISQRSLTKLILNIENHPTASQP